MKVIIIKLIRLLALAFIPALIISACGPGDSGSDEETANCPPPVSSYSVIQINADIDTPATWTYGNVYVINKYDFYVESTLTIEAGVIIKFHPVNGPYMMLDSSSGRIIANGNLCRPIIFTSYKDDAHGGDTNGDGSATSPAKEDWIYINTNEANASVFNYCEFYYGGGNDYNSVLCLYGKATTVTNCIFAHNKSGKYDDYYFGALDANVAETGTIITGNTFYDNILPLSISSQINIDDSNTFHNGATGNTLNGIFLHAGDDFADNITWAETEVAFVMYDNSLWVNSGYSLTLGNNTVIKFMAGVTFNLEDGQSALVNHGGAGVYFTSYRDDTHKGDTNGDGNATSPAYGNWNGIYDDTAPGPNYYFTWPNILYDSY